MEPGAASQVPMWAAALAGTAGSLVMLVPLQRLKKAGVTRLDVLLLVGTVFAPPGPRAERLGLAWHLLGGIAFGVIYATLFELAGVEVGLGAASALGLLHGLLSGLSMVTVPFRNRRVAMGEVADPGIFALNFGWPAACALVGSHVLFGATFGLLYPPLAALAA